MSFKYRFILSFVLLEVFFIVLIVSINFVTINNSSRQLINDKIESTITFLEQLLVVPLSIYDLATLDNLVENSKDQKYINSIVILDKQDRVLSKRFQFKHVKFEDLLQIKKNKKFSFENENYEIKIKKILEDGSYIGSIYLVFDTSESIQFIKNNREKTFFIIIFEILISTFLAYFIGSRLTNMLTKLAQVAQDIGENKHPDIPYQDKTDEIGALSKSMSKMQVDIKTRNTALHKQKLDLEESNKYKDDFLANMSHELKTPLNSINVISSVMAKNSKNELNEKQVKNLSIINQSGQELLSLINEVLDLSKLEAGELPIFYESFDIHSLMTSIYENIEPLAKEKNLLFNLDIKIQEHFAISDKKRVKQVIQNLLSNAIKFTQKGSVTFKVRENESEVILNVIDSGIGIPKDKCEHIFDRFKQVDGSITRQFGGTGLGLSISKELSNILRGDLTVTSEFKKGSDFQFTFPKNTHMTKEDIFNENSFDKNSSSQENTELELLLGNDTKDKEDEKINVLLFNSDPVTFFALIVSMKKQSGINFSYLKSAQEIISELDSQTTNILIIDLDSMDIKLEEYLKSKNQLFIIALSHANVTCEYADTLLEKPVDIKSLLPILFTKENT